MSKCDSCGSKHTNVYKHELDLMGKDRVNIRWVNCLDCLAQSHREVKILPMVVGKRK